MSIDSEVMLGILEPADAAYHLGKIVNEISIEDFKNIVNKALTIIEHAEESFYNRVKKKKKEPDKRKVSIDEIRCIIMEDMWNELPKQIREEYQNWLNSIGEKITQRLNICLGANSGVESISEFSVVEDDILPYGGMILQSLFDPYESYSLIVEEGTPLCENLDKYAPVPDEEEDRRMYQQTKQILESHGYQRYEISNFAKTGYECRHNKIYWQRGIEHLTNYLGLGLGAASTIDRRRWKNTSNMDQYLQAFLIHGNQNKQEQFIPEKDIKEEMQMLSEKDCMEEFMFLGLRMMCGISITEFQNSFGKSIDAVYGKVLQKWTAQGMLARENDIVKLTDAGIDISNIILADFLL